MSFLAKNLAHIQKHLPRLYQTLTPCLETQAWQLVKEEAGWFNAQKVLGDEPSRFYQTHPDDLFGECEQASKLVAPRILVFDGVGLGYHIMTLLKKQPTCLREVVIVERDVGLFLQALAVQDFESLITAENVLFLVGQGVETMIPVLRDYFLARERLIYSHRIEHFYFLPALKEAGAYYLDVAKAMKQAIDELVITYNVLGEDNYRGLLNICDNLSVLRQAPTAGCFKGVLQGLPAVIVAAGPSLKQHLPWLVKHRDRVVVACVDGSMASLVKHGIRPHLLFSMEREITTSEYFRHLPIDCKVPLFLLAVAHPQTMANHTGPKVVVPRHASMGRWLYPDDEQFFIGVNVAAMAYRMLAHMGCTGVYLLGQDLAYERGTNQTHVGEVDPKFQKFFGEMKQTSQACDVPGNNGQPITTTMWWRTYKEDFEYLIDHMGVYCANVIRPEQGAMIRGAARLDPVLFWEQTVPAFAAHDASSRLAHVLATAGLPQTGVRDSGALFEQTQKYLSEVGDRVLALMREVSREHRDDLPVGSDEAMVARYEKRFGDWQQQVHAIRRINPFLYDNFLACFFHSEYLQIMAEREKHIPVQGFSFVRNHIYLTQKMLMHWHHWCSRTSELLKATKDSASGWV